jgi:hypothetical protein
MHGIVEDILGLTEGRRGVSYFPRIDLAHIAAKAINVKLPGSAYAIDGEMDPLLKRRIIAAHRAGEFLHLTNCGVVTEGHDDPGIAYVAQVRPTMSFSRFMQEMGRGGRPLAPVDTFATAAERRACIAASSKPNCLVLDFVGNLGKHADGIANPVDALAGKLDDEETRKRAKKILAEQGGGDVEEALEAARRLSERERQKEAERVVRVEAARYQWGREIDPFSALGIAPQSDVVGELVSPPSLKMKQFIFRHMGTCPPTLSDADAQRLSKTIRARAKAGLADFKTVKWLTKHGISAMRMYQSTADRVREAIRSKRDWSEVEAIVNGGRAPGEEG